jgi:DNA-binding GntR family transcriptional regulator
MKASRKEAGSNTKRAEISIRNMILRNELVAGKNYLETELAEMLRMSRTPVREACIALAASGLVEVQPRHGIRILEVSASDMAEIYDILTELESLAAFSIASRGCTPEELERLESLLRAMDEALEKGDRKAWAQADVSFHAALVEMSANRRLQQVVTMFSDQAHRARLATLDRRPLPYASNADHRALVEAITRGAAEEAWNLHRNHRIAAKKLLSGILEQIGN